jgi:hypothetical protein
VHQEFFKNGDRTLIGATLKNLVKNLIGEFFLYNTIGVDDGIVSDSDESLSMCRIRPLNLGAHALMLPP